MAKLAQVTYGLDGQGEPYTYVVNDNVRAGQVINPIVKHYKSGNTFATTGIIQASVQRDSVRGQSLEEGVKQVTDGQELAESKTASGLGITRETRGSGGRFSGSQSSTGGAGKITKDSETGRYSAENPEEYVGNSYIQAQRGANLQNAKTPIAETPIQQDAQETFAQYSKKFMPKD